MTKELPIPGEAVLAKKSQEFVRGRIIDSITFCSLNIGVWGNKEPAFWGLFLSDVAHHVADALNKDKGWDKTATIARIQESFNKAEITEYGIQGRFCVNRGPILSRIGSVFDAELDCPTPETTVGVVWTWT